VTSPLVKIIPSCHSQLEKAFPMRDGGPVLLLLLVVFMTFFRLLHPLGKCGLDEGVLSHEDYGSLVSELFSASMDLFS
jgi:hypothetical protein